MLPDLLHALNILSDLAFEQVGRGVEVVAVSEVVPSIDEPLGDAEGDGIGNDLLDLLPGLFADFPCSRVEVDLGDLANQVCQSRSDSSDGGQREGDLPLALQVGVQHSDDVLEFYGALVYETLALITIPSTFEDFIKEMIRF